MHPSILRLPLPRLLLPFILRIVLCLQVAQTDLPQVVWLPAAIVVLPLVLHAVFASGICHSDRFHGPMYSLTLFSLGFWFCHNHHESLDSGHLAYAEEVDNASMLVQLLEPVSEKENTFQLVVSVLQYGNDSTAHPVSGRMILYLEKDSLAQGLSYGDRLLVRGEFREIRPPVNPHAFDYRMHLARKNIYHSAYVRSGHWMAVGENHGRLSMHLALGLRDRAMAVFQAHHLGDREFALISALLLGYREYLDEEMRREFAGAGAMHILCVSGLHVGIIFMVLKAIFSFLLRLPGGRYLQTACIILLIWLYAAITGFSPSVLRASVMFTFVAAGQSFSRKGTIYNTLAASAFVLLINDPFIIAHIGFQLSYLAVISIVSLQPWLERLWRPKQYLVKKAWSITTVSVAAQLATGPLAIHYFHQFPNYFVLTNLLVIPLATLIIYTALLTLVLSPLPYAGCFTGQVLTHLIRAMNGSVSFIEGLPHSTAENLYISFFDTIMIFLVLIGFFTYLMRGARRSLLFGLVIMLLLASSLSLRHFRNTQQKGVVVYHVNRGTASDFIHGRQAVFMACEHVVDSPRLMQFSLSANRLGRGVRALNPLPLNGDSLSLCRDVGLASHGPLIHFHGMSMFLLDDGYFVQLLDSCCTDRRTAPNGSCSPVPLIRVNYLLVTGNPRVDVPLLLRHLEPDRVIIDASNAPWRAAVMEEAFTEAGVDVWNIRHLGAYEVTW